MAARVKVEFVHLGHGKLQNGCAEGVVAALVSSLAPIAVTTTATAAGARPTVPTGDGHSPLYARVTALDNPVVMAWGDDPTASATSGIRLVPNVTDAVLVAPGQKLSFIEVT